MNLTNRLPFSWGASAEERCLALPCDSILPRADRCYHRATTITAAADLVFENLRVLLLGSQAPVATGQPAYGFFQVVAFEPGHSITLRTVRGRRETKIYGEIAVAYVITPEGERTRVLVRVHVLYARFYRLVLRFLLPWADLVMTFFQLRKLRRLATRV